MNFMTKKVSNFNTMDLITYEEEHFMKKINWIQIIKIQAIIFLYSIINCFVFSRKRNMDGNGYFINHVNSIGKLCFFMAKIVKES